MVASVRSNPWPLIALVLGLVLAYDLGARTQLAAPALAGVASDRMSIQIDVTGPEQMVYMVPVGMTFVLRDLLLSNSQANSKGSLDVGQNIYPSLYNGFGATASLKIAGTNLRDWAKGNNNSPFGGGRSNKKSSNKSQTGFVGLTGGVVFEAGTMVVVRDYDGPLFLSGELYPSS